MTSLKSQKENTLESPRGMLLNNGRQNKNGPSSRNGFQCPLKTINSSGLQNGRTRETKRLNERMLSGWQMHEPKDDEPRREKTRDFAPVGFSDVTLPAKTQTLAWSREGERKRARKKWHSSRDASKHKYAHWRYPRAEFNASDKKNAGKTGKDTRSPPC